MKPSAAAVLVLVVVVVFASVGGTTAEPAPPAAAKQQVRRSAPPAALADEAPSKRGPENMERWLRARVVSSAAATAPSSVGTPVEADEPAKVARSSVVGFTETKADDNDLKDPLNADIGHTLTTTLALVFAIGCVIAFCEFVARMFEIQWLSSRNLVWLVVFERVRKELVMIGLASFMVFFFTDSKELDRLLSRMSATALGEKTIDLGLVWHEIHLCLLYVFVTLPIVGAWLACCANRTLLNWSTMDWCSTQQYDKGWKKTAVKVDRTFIRRQGLSEKWIFLPYLKASTVDTLGQIFNIGWITWMDVALIGLVVCGVFRVSSELDRSILFVDIIYCMIGFALILWQVMWIGQGKVAMARWLSAEDWGSERSEDRAEITVRHRDASVFLWFKSRRLYMFGACEIVVFNILYLATLGILSRKQDAPESYAVLGIDFFLAFVNMAILPRMVNTVSLCMATGDPNIGHFTNQLTRRQRDLDQSIKQAESAGIKVYQNSVDDWDDTVELEDLVEEVGKVGEEEIMKLKKHPLSFARLFGIAVLKDYWLGANVQQSTMREYAALFHSGVFDVEVQMKNIRNFVIALVGILLVITQLQVAWDGAEVHHNKTTAFLKFMVMMDTILLVLGVLDYYALQQKIFLTRHFIGRREFAKKVHVWNFPELMVPLIAEVVVCAFHPFPFQEVFAWDDKWSLLIFVRLYLFVRIIRDATYVHRHRNFIQKAARKQGRNPVFNWALSCKILYHDYVMPCNLLLWAVAVLVLSYCIYVCERETQPEIFQGDGTMFYFTAVTMTTVGYGDISPKSRAGRIMAIMIAFTGIVLTSLFTAVVTNQLNLNEHQEFARDWVARDRLEKLEPNMAQLLIKETWRAFIRRRRSKTSPEVVSGAKRELWPRFKPSIKTQEGVLLRAGLRPAFESRSIALAAQMSRIRQRKLEMTEKMRDDVMDRLDVLEGKFEKIGAVQQEILEALGKKK